MVPPPACPAPVAKPSRRLSLSVYPQMREPSSAGLPVQITVSRLDKLKKIWHRRPKFITAPGPAGTSPPPATRSSLAPSTRSNRHGRRTTLATDMIGLPQGFIHSKHIGIHDVRELAYQPRHSVGVDRILDPAELASSLYRLTDSDGELHSEEEKLPIAPPRRRSHQQERRPRAPAHRPAAQPAPPPNKVKRKSVPIHILQDLAEQPAAPPSPGPGRASGEDPRSSLSIDEAVRELISCAQPEHMGGGEYISHTVKTRWDAKMAQVAHTLNTPST